MSKIEWTNKAWNPLAGCSRVSPGCVHCYAETMAKRLKAMGVKEYQEVVNKTGWTRKIRLIPAKLNEPLHWRKPQMIFVNSMSDLFHKDVPFIFISSVWQTMYTASQHTYQILTKRPERALEWFNWAYMGKEEHKNIWLGVSIENQEQKKRIEVLQRINIIRFISFEPLLEDIGEINLNGISWVIIGGESGPGARPFNIDWARNIIRQCKEQKVPIFMKQVGSNPIGWDANKLEYKRAHLKSRKGSDMKEWPVDLRIREYQR